MPRPDPRSDVRLDVNAGAHARAEPDSAPRPAGDDPFRIAILGDFSGRAARGIRRSADELAALAPMRVDRDELDRALDTLRPRLEIPTTLPGVPSLPIEFRRFEDFHPDALYERLPVFEELRELRRLAGDPGRFEGSAEAPDRSASGSPSGAPGAGLLDEILGGEGGSAPSSGSPRPRSELESFIRGVAAPHRVEAAPVAQADAQRRIDQAVGEQLREILRHRRFRALESLWRGVRMVTLRLETDARLQVHLVDITRDELEDELERAAGGERSGLIRLLVGPARTPGEAPWSLLVGCYAFRPGQASLLARIGGAARAAGAPFVSRAASELAGTPALRGLPDPRDWTRPDDIAWEALRRSAEGRWIGLILPRFLLRLPYGAEGEAADVALEEASTPPDHEDFLWGNPALLSAILLGEAFSRDGWAMRPERALEVDRLPLYVGEAGGQAFSQPSAEALLTDDAVERLMDLGFMPLAPFRDQDRARLGRFQSIALPLATLSGPWG